MIRIEQHYHNHYQYIKQVPTTSIISKKQHQQSIEAKINEKGVFKIAYHTQRPPAHQPTNQFTINGLIFIYGGVFIQYNTIQTSITVSNAVIIIIKQVRKGSTERTNNTNNTPRKKKQPSNKFFYINVLIKQQNIIISNMLVTEKQNNAMKQNTQQKFIGRKIRTIQQATQKLKTKCMQEQRRKLYSNCNACIYMYVYKYI
eukprot:TRINITY_DN3421_c1_g1_i1.p2 TRINITY_DN3421_c1_g1~~TRINITY_DN3421_c1_g1_i1.p2  ORF type:complete len:234 (+),score=-10.81 TRINITY_DN3421_c1_g1_i1:102-704(+)